MAGLPDESAGQSQAHGCSSYPLSFPSQPPDIRNWFSSYQYESPEVPELDADPGGDDGSETQDPLEYRAPGHSFLKHACKAGGTASKGGCFGSKSEHDEVSATRDVLPIGRSTVEQGKRKRSLRELFGSGFLDDHDEAAQTESQVVSPVKRSAVDPMWDFNWVGLRNGRCSHEGATEHSELLADSDSTIIAETQGNPPGGPETDHSKQPVNCGGNFNWVCLRNRKRIYEGAVEHSDLPTDSESTCIAETQENHPGGQQTDHIKHPVNCGGTSLADTEEGFLEDGIEHSNLPVNSHSKGLSDAGKTKQSLRELFGAGFLDYHDKANNLDTRVVSAVQRSAVEPLSNCNAVGLPYTDQINEDAAGYGELLVDCDVISLAETQETPPGGQMIKQNGLPVNCGGTSLAEDTEEGCLEDGTEHSKLPANSHSTGPADIEKIDIEHRILPADSNGIGSAVTEKRSSGDETTLNHNKTEGTVAADGFIAIRTKVKPAEECRAIFFPKPSRARETAPLQENRGILGIQTARDRTRSPLSDRTNLSEVLAAPAQEISGKWKCPSKGKPYVAPPMKQLRLEQWVRRVN